MFSFYQVVEYLEEQELQELFTSPTLAAIAGVLGLHHLIKKGEERDVMIYCKSECSRILDRREWEQCAVDCYNRKITIMQHHYKTARKI